MFKRPELHPSLASRHLFRASASTVVDMTNEESDSQEEEASSKVKQQPAVGTKRDASEVEGSNLLEARKKSKRMSSQGEGSHVTDGDAYLALVLQAEEDEFHRTETRAHKKEEAERAMTSTKHGRAWLFVNRVLDLHRRLSSSSSSDDDDMADPRMTTVAVDDMVFLAERLIDFQSTLRRRGTNANVTIGYHYTREKNIESIKRDGLMTQAERNESGVRTAGSHGAHYGDGIYIATNPFVFRNTFGDVGLMAAVVLGNAQRAVRFPRDAVDVDRSLVNTLIGNKRLDSLQEPWRRTSTLTSEDVESVTPYHDEIVLLQSSQCVPVMRFCSTLVSKANGAGRWHRGNEIVWRYQEELQGILNEFFNDGAPTEPQIVLPPGQVRTKWQRKSVTADHAAGFVPGNGVATSAIAPSATASVSTSAAGTSSSSAALPKSSTSSLVSGVSHAHQQPSKSNGPDCSTRNRQKQQRLLLLHHSSKCQVPDTQKCQVTQHCGEIKRLWKHMSRCSDSQCRVQHCYSSRSILSHYRRCKDAKCTVCGPVRETVRRSAGGSRTRGSISQSSNSDHSLLMQNHPSQYTNNAAPAAAVTVAVAPVANGTVSPRPSPPPAKAKAVVVTPPPNISNSSVASTDRVLNGAGWRSDGDMGDRRRMMAAIIQHLQQRRPNASPEQMKQLPSIVKRLEESVYLSAPSLRAYNDVSTLQDRLTQQAKLSNTPIGPVYASPQPPPTKVQRTMDTGRSTDGRCGVPQEPQQQQKQGKPHADPSSLPSSLSSSCLNGKWRSARDIIDRRRIIANIVMLLKEREKHAATDSERLKKLAQMAKKLEVSLYRSAPSFAAYSDANTLRHRLQQLAQEIGVEAAKAKMPQSSGEQSNTVSRKSPASWSSPIAVPQQQWQRQPSQLQQAGGTAPQHPLMPHQSDTNNRATTSSVTHISAPQARPNTPSSTVNTSAQQQWAAVAAEQKNIDAVLRYYAPPTLKSSALESNLQGLPNCVSKSECPICLEPLNSPGKVVRLKKCKHEFHENCIDSALKTVSKCPVCRRRVGEPQGFSPSGEMRVSTIPSLCSGFEPCLQSIEITYVMCSGTQMSYHENPGRVYSGTTRKAYLPDNADGRRLLSRLQYAFLHGLTFTIGTSLTTRRPNSIVWSSVHHKTSLSGGLQSHGFPDPGFFMNCNEELDALGVPSSEECDF